MNTTTPAQAGEGRPNMGTIVTIRRITRCGRTGWQGIVLATVPTEITIGLRETAAEVEGILARMLEVGMLKPGTTWKVAS